MGHFSEATAVEATGPGVFTADLDPQWSVGTKLHGGYLLAVVARAAGQLADDHEHLQAISGSFPSAPEPGPAEIKIEVLARSRTLTQLRASLTQDGKPRVEALVTQSKLTDEGPWWSGLEPVGLPDEQDCVQLPPKAPGAGFDVPLLEVVEARLDPKALGFAAGQPGRTGAVASWQRMADGSDWDPLSLLVALDPVPPVSFELGAPGWAPTLQMSAFIRRLPASGPVRVNMFATDVGANRMDETAYAWDSKGRLVAQALQLAAPRVPKN
jgi:hypothetical protein